MSSDRDDSFLQSSPTRFIRTQQLTEICPITPELISEVSGNTLSNISKLQSLDLHLKDEHRGKIRKIENMVLVPQLRLLNLSYNAIIKIEGLGRLHSLVELNLAENAIRKIENLDSLHSLKRLNLSGNQIQRIPESITSLQRLSNLRIARNELDVVGDLTFLGNLMNLTKLRIDENPFSSLEHTALFAIFSVRSLVYLDGTPVTAEDREEARARFATSNIAELRGRLAEELHNLTKLKIDVGRSPERRLTQRRVALSRDASMPAPLFNEAQRALDEAHYALAEKLQQISESEGMIARLQGQIDVLQDTGTGRGGTTTSNNNNNNNNNSGGGGGGGTGRRDLSPLQQRGEAAVRAATYSGQLAPGQQQQQQQQQSQFDGGYGSAPTNNDNNSRYSNIYPSYDAPVTGTSAAPYMNINDNNNTNNHNNSDRVQNPHYPSPPTPSHRYASPPSRGPGRSPPTGASSSSSSSLSGGGGTVSKALAAQQIAQLNERIDNLAGKLIEADRENTLLKQQLAQSQRSSAGSAAGEQEHNTTQNQNQNQESEQQQATLELLGKLKDQTQQLQTALAAKEREAVLAKEEMDRATAEVTSLRIDCSKNTLIKDNLKTEIDAINAENAKIRQEMLELRSTIMQNDNVLSENTIRRLGEGSAMDQWRNHEARVEIAAQRSDLEEIRRANEKLQRELEFSLRETTLANESCTRAKQEADALRAKLNLEGETSKTQQAKLQSIESELRRMSDRLAEEANGRQKYEQECIQLKAALTIQEAEMQSYLKARETSPSVVKYPSARLATNTAADKQRGGSSSSSSGIPDRPILSSGLFQSPNRIRSNEDGTYFDIISNGSDADDDSDDNAGYTISAGSGAGHQQGLASRKGGRSAVGPPSPSPAAASTRRTARRSNRVASAAGGGQGTSAELNRPFVFAAYKSPMKKFSVTKLELAAAEIVASVLLQEIAGPSGEDGSSNNNYQLEDGAGVAGKRVTKTAKAAVPVGASSNGSNSCSSGRTRRGREQLKDACIRAALRVVHSSTSMMRAQQLLSEQEEEEDHADNVDQEEEEDEEEESEQQHPNQHQQQATMTPHRTPSRSPSPAHEATAESKLNDSLSDSPAVLHASNVAGGGQANATYPQQQPRRSKTLHKPRKSSSRRVEILPFHALGNRDFLSKLVAETHAGLAAIEDSDRLKEEIQQLEKIIRELETKALMMENTVAAKSATVQSLHKHCDDAKEQAQGTLNELEVLTKRLQDGRDAMTRTEAEHTLAKRELDLTRNGLQEALAMSEIEHNNMQTVRSRIAELKQELQLTEQQLLQTKEAAMKENDKLRATKAMATDQLRLLQMDLNKIQSDFKTKQRSIEDLEKQRRTLEEEMEIKKRDADNQLAVIVREYEEESRKCNNVKCDIRVQKLELDQLISKRRQLEGEVGRMQEILSTETSRYDAEEQEGKRRLLQYEKQLAEAEKKVRDSREKIGALEGEEVILRHSVEEQRRQQADLERASEARRRTTEEELTRVQHQAQVAQRALRQAESQMEVKRAELESLQLELRSVERRCDEIKRQTREHEMVLDAHRDTVKELDVDRERMFKDSAAIRKEEDELRHQSQLLRSSLEHDTRECEDIRRRIVTLKEEEISLKESDARLRSTLLQSKSTLESAQSELDELRSANERERRALSDIRAKKNVAEADVSRLQEELKFETERRTQESMGRVEMEASTARTHEDLTRLQKQLVATEKRIEDAVRREEELKRRETALKANIERLRLETEGLASQQTSEKSSVNHTRESLRDLDLELRREKENLRAVQKELQSAYISLETVQAQKMHMETLREEFSSELHRIRETASVELKRTERLEGMYNEAEQRLKSVRADLSQTEKSYERARNQTSEEEQRVHGQRRALRLTLDELAKVEKAVAEAHRQMYEERQRALVEIGQLGQAKQSTQAQMFLTSEAQKRLQQPYSAATASSSGHRGLSQAGNMGIAQKDSTEMTIPGYLTSHLTSALYPTTRTTTTMTAGTGAGAGAGTGAGISSSSRGVDSSTSAGMTSSTFNSTAYDTNRWAAKAFSAPSSSSSSTSVGIGGGGGGGGGGSHAVDDLDSRITASIIAGGAAATTTAVAEEGRTGSTMRPEVELSSLQQEVEKLRLQSAAVLNSTGTGTGTDKNSIHR